MTADPFLDFSIEAMSATPSLRRPHGIGGSEIALSMMAFGLAEGDAPRWMKDKAETAKRHGVPRWVAQKLGLAKRDSGATQDRGTAREPEVLLSWIARLERDEWQHECERAIDPSTVQWLGALPVEFPPFHDRDSPIAVRPDAWARTWGGELVLVSLKCARYGYSKPAWWNGITEVPWYYAVQCDAEHAAIYEATRSIFVVGCGWNRDDEDPRSDGPILALPVERIPARIELARSAARMAWSTYIAPRFHRT